jgi:hypothetical protein
VQPGDRVYVDGVFENGAFEQGIVSEVHAHDVVVHVQTAAGYDERTYARECLSYAPTLRQSSRFFPR